MAMGTLNRRDFMKGGVVLASGAALLGMAGCSPNTSENVATTEQSSLPIDLQMSDIENSSVELGTIDSFEEEQTYDIVVVGAGCAGVPAVLTAVEEGATVACLQKLGSVAANGYGSSAIYIEGSTPAGLKRWMEDFCETDDDRVKRGLFQHHLDHSGETLSWIIQRANEAGVEGITYSTTSTVAYDDEQIAAVFDISVGSGNTEMMAALADYAAQQGAVFYYDTPAVQLIQDEDGTVTGVIGTTGENSYIKVNATKGVVLATGDYMNNDSLMNRYSRDVYKRYLYLQDNRTGDGHILGILAGARIAPPCHARQVHGVIPWFMKTPLLMLNSKGERFINEQIKMTSWNSAATSQYPAGEEVVLYRFFDSEYETKYAETQPIPPKEALLDPAIDEGNPTSVYDFHNAFHRADTIEELCEQVGLPYDAVQQSIDRYNELAAKGVDDDFGVERSQLKPIETAPFYCIKDQLGLAAINGGFTVDNNYQAIDAEGNPIPHLWGAGVCADNVCGGINWGMPGGFSNSHCFTSGRYTVLCALHGEPTPSNPCTFEQVENYYREAGAIAWEDTSVALTAPDIW